MLTQEASAIIDELFMLAEDHKNYPGSITGMTVVNKIEKFLAMPGCEKYRKQIFRHLPMSLFRNAIRELLDAGQDGWKAGKKQEARRILDNKWLVRRMGERSRPAKSELKMLKAVVS